MGQMLRSGPFPQPGCPAPRRAQQAAGTAPRNAGLMGWLPRPVTATGRDGQAPPEQFAGDHRRTKRSTVNPKGQPSAPAGLPPSLHRRPRSSAPPPLPRSSGLPAQRGRTLTRRRRPTRPVPDAQSRGSEVNAKKDAEESQISLELATFPKPSQSPVQPPPPPPGRQGAQREAGTRWPD